MNNTNAPATNLYIVYYGSTSNHSYPMTFKCALAHLTFNADPRWWVGRSA